jgi:hypothetical protein
MYCRYSKQVFQLLGAVVCSVIVASLPARAAAKPAPRAPVELAVLHVEDGRRFALPFLSLPATDSRQLQDMEGRMERSSDVSLAVDRCRKKARAAVDLDRLQCALPRALVVQHHYMRKVPSDWRDSRGAAYRVFGGRYFEHPAGSDVGFDLGPNRPKVPLGTVVLTSERHVRFADRRVLEAKVWRRWPELAQELSAWRKSESGKCTDASTCMAKSAYASHLRGVALEYTLQDGRRLQFLRAESRPVDGNNRLLVRLWRSADYLARNERRHDFGREAAQALPAAFPATGSAAVQQ